MIIALLTITYIGVFSRGIITVHIYNDTESNQKVGFQADSDIRVYTIPSQEKKNIKCKTIDFNISLVMNYLDKEGISQNIVLAEYIEDNYFGDIYVRIKPGSDGHSIDFDIKEDIRF